MKNINKFVILIIILLIFIFVAVSRYVYATNSIQKIMGIPVDEVHENYGGTDGDVNSLHQIRDYSISRIGNVKANLFFGDGRDGNVTASVNLYTDGDGQSFKVASNPTSTSIDVGEDPSGVFSAGDKLLLIDLQSSGAATDTGNYEILDVTGTSGNNITVKEAPSKTYASGVFGNEYVYAQRIPQYGNVTLGSGETITTSAFDNAGDSTGVVAIFVNDTLTIESGGTIHANELGFTGGVSTGFGPQDYTGVTTNGGDTGDSGGSADADENGGDGTGGGSASLGGTGGDGESTSSTSGCAGGYEYGAPGKEGGGGGSGWCGLNERTGGGGGGGGAAYTVAQVNTPNDFSKIFLASGSSQGAGGGGGGGAKAWDGTTCTGGTGGQANGTAGSGGNCTGSDCAVGDSGGAGSGGNRGGGIVMIFARTISATTDGDPSIEANGGDGGAGGSGGRGGRGDNSGHGGGGGGGQGGQGGSGGSIMLVAHTMTLGSDAVVAFGGDGGAGGNGGSGGKNADTSGRGGTGGDGATFDTGNGTADGTNPNNTGAGGNDGEDGNPIMSNNQNHGGGGGGGEGGPSGPYGKVHLRYVSFDSVGFPSADSSEELNPNPASTLEL